jgi:hypothetical protein
MITRFTVSAIPIAAAVLNADTLSSASNAYAQDYRRTWSREDAN